MRWIQQLGQFFAELFDLIFSQQTYAREVTVGVVERNLLLREPKTAPIYRYLRKLKPIPDWLMID